MVFRRILALVALFAWLGACTPDANPPQTAAAAGAPGRPSPLPRDIEREVGPVYSDAQLQALVDRIGQRLVTQSGISGTYKFYILDQPVPNAGAVLPGYIFVTRGILAMVDDDAELAAAIGHELGHISQGHHAQRARQRKSVIDAAVQATLTSGSINVGRSVARSGMLELRRYSREQELEADRAGLGYLVKAGYRGDAMVGLIEKLRRQTQLEDKLMGQSAEPPERSALSTHPAPDARLAALAELPLARQSGPSDRAAYLALIDGMSVDDSPEEGFVRGPNFLHPTMRFAFNAPADFKLYNDREGVVGVGNDRSLLYFSCSTDKVSGTLADWMRNKVQPTPIDIQSTTIDGQDAAIGAKARGSDTGLNQIRYVMVRRGESLCFFNLAADGPDRDRRIDVLVNAARSFRTLSPAEAAALRPYRLHVEPRGNATAAQVAQRMPYVDFKLDRLLALNGVDDVAGFARLTAIKTVE